MIGPAIVVFRAVSKVRNPRCIVVMEVVIAKAMTIAASITSRIVKPESFFLHLIRARSAMRENKDSGGDITYFRKINS